MKKIKIFALIGKAGSGKDFFLHEICSRMEVHEIISCTTRPIRDNEEPDINYHYLTDEQFLSQQFIESCMFRGWRYGTRLKDLDENKPNVGVFNLSGIEQLMENKNIDLTIFYLDASDATRLIRQLQRESNPDINEIFRRFQTDNDDFSSERINNIITKCKFYPIFNDTENETIYNVTKIEEIIKADFNS